MQWHKQKLGNGALTTIRPDKQLTVRNKVRAKLFRLMTRTDTRRHAVGGGWSFTCFVSYICLQCCTICMTKSGFTPSLHRYCHLRRHRQELQQNLSGNEGMQVSSALDDNCFQVIITNDSSWLSYWTFRSPVSVSLFCSSFAAGNSKTSL